MKVSFYVKLCISALSLDPPLLSFSVNNVIKYSTSSIHYGPHFHKTLKIDEAFVIIDEVSAQSTKQKFN